MIKTNKKENEKFMNPPSIFLDFFRWFHIIDNKKMTFSRCIIVNRISYYGRLKIPQCQVSEKNCLTVMIFHKKEIQWPRWLGAFWINWVTNPLKYFKYFWEWCKPFLGENYFISHVIASRRKRVLSSQPWFF
jgi:hypothetical protein